jgi:hypothetical protein
LIVGNLPFVTARNPKKRELYRERWPRVCHGEFQLVCPFFEMSFGLLKPSGQLGFIVSNAFAMREFGQPLLERFLPTVHLQKIVNCDGLSFPGHGTPTCLVFSRQPNSKSDTKWIDEPVRIASRLAGGGDLLAMPEESPLWQSLAAHHDLPGFSDGRIIVSDRPRIDVFRWPFNFDPTAALTKKEIDERTSNQLDDFIDTVGYSVLTKSDDIFFVPPHVVRIAQIEQELLQALNVGDELRNWTFIDSSIAICPYYPDFKPVEINKYPKCLSWLTPFRRTLESVITFGQTKAEAGKQWFEHFDAYPDRHALGTFLAYADIATHNHFVGFNEDRLLKDTAPLVALHDTGALPLVAGLMNSSVALFYLKQICFNKGAGSSEHRDRFEFATKKVKQLRVPTVIADALDGKSNALAEGLAALARECWERGHELPSITLRKLFEKADEAYHTWNASLPGYLRPHKDLDAPFSSTNDLEKNFASAQEIREKLRREMIARQEEMDWLVYAAYGLIGEDHPAAQTLAASDTDALQLNREERPFRLWSKADCDFEKAAALIPSSWSASKKKLWRARLEAIRDNEHIRRIEQPVYKRRWDEQWKVGNSWECGPVAYAQELLDAFTWWLSEKAEWHLEHKAKGGPIALQDWSAALFKDARVAAAWPVTANAIYEVEKYKSDVLDEEKKEPRRNPKADDSYTAFERFFRELVLDQSVAHGIPPAKPWNELAEKKKWTSAQLKKAQGVRGKLNVPRERFRIGSAGEFFWAGSD